MQKPKILIVGHSLNDSNGLSYMSFLVVKKLQELKYDLTYMNISTVDMDEKCFIKYGLKNNIPILNANVYDQKCSHIFDTYLKENKIDIVITIHDPWLLDHVVYSVYRNTFFWIAYQTFETDHYPNNLIAPTAVYPFKDKYKHLDKIFQSCDLVVPCSKHGVKALNNYDVKCNENSFVYLGLDTVPDKRIIQKFASMGKKNTFGINEDIFLFMVLGVNNQRKKIDVTLMAFRKFLDQFSEEERKKYKLYLHTEIRRNFNGADLIEIIQQLKLDKNVIIEAGVISRDILYQRYANIDCFISLYGAEGFCLPIVEAMLFNKPVIYTDYAVPSEYVNYGEGVKPCAFIYSANFCIKLAIADIDDAVIKMNKVVTEYKPIDNYDYIKEKFDWNTNFKTWHEKMIYGYTKWLENEDRFNIPIKRII